jgi:2-keto-4-pentenoate hydratase/2-oxohepta-3-ene-1,7-dioic acid hydratase in catechol pathway
MPVHRTDYHFDRRKIMKLLNFRKGNEIRLGIKTDKGVIDVEKAAYANSMKAPVSMEQAIAGGEKALWELGEIIKKDNDFVSEKNMSYAPILANPEKILCIGLNYKPHAEECEMKIPENPVIFSKFNNALSSHNDTVRLPKGAHKFDYEAELVIVMGKEASNVSPEDALSYVFGYTTGNDLSARDLQFVSGQWLLGKTCDGFAPIGPYLVTAGDVDPDSLDISCEVNGKLLQSSNTSYMIFDCAAIVSYISRYMTLKPGDIIYSGTPDGVVLGYPEHQQVWLKSGDRITVSIENIGSLTTTLK